MKFFFWLYHKVFLLCNSLLISQNFGISPKFQPGFYFLRECSHLDQRRRQEYAVANSLLLKKSSIIQKKKVFMNILSLFYRTFSFVEYFVIVLQFEYIFKNVLSMNARSSQEFLSIDVTSKNCKTKTLSPTLLHQSLPPCKIILK